MSHSSAGQIRIGSTLIGPGNPVWIVAEAGVNHNGDPGLAQELVREAKRAGADCVKFQTFSASRVASAGAAKAPYQLRSTDAGESQLEMLRKLELDEGALGALVGLCREEGIEFLSTPYSVDDVELLESLGVRAYKVASALIVEPNLLRRIGATRKPVLLSTGLATLAEVEESAAVLRDAGNEELVVLQCTTDYPAPPGEANLRAMQTMASAVGALPGYSDHTETSTTAIAAVALGAVVIEKHLTLDRSLPGPDQATSASPSEFRELVRAIRMTEAALGDGRKEPGPSEQRNLESMRRSLVATRTIEAGTELGVDMLTAKRPAGGIPPRDLEGIVGRLLKVTIVADQPIEWWMLE